MTKEQSEVIKDIKIYIHDIISESVDEVGYKRYEISEEEQEFFNNIERLLNMLKEQDKEIEKKEKMKQMTKMIIKQMIQKKIMMIKKK